MNVQLLHLPRVKITTLFLIIAYLLCQSPVFADKGAVDHKPIIEEITLIEAIHRISEQYQVLFNYDRNIVSDIKVRYESREFASVDAAIGSVLKETNLKYQIFSQRYVVIYKNDQEGIESLKEMIEHFQNIVSDREDIVAERKKIKPSPVLETSLPRDLLSEMDISFSIEGTVTDQDGEPLIGVNIQVKGTNLGTSTDFDGKFTIDEIDENAVLVVSYIGYQTQEVTVSGKSNLTITLISDSQLLDEVVVVGYGTVKKSDLTGSVTSVQSEDFVKGVATNALQLLSGKASGVNVSQTNSEPGANMNIMVRGAGSINSSNSVLVVIDGFPGGNLSNINPMDIESIEILKDASAAAIYGTRAANGVVLVTTKKGQSDDKTRITYSTDWAYQAPSSRLDVLNGMEYMQMINDISRDAGRDMPYTEAQISSAGKGTDWQEELFRNALISNHQLSLSGGNERSKYYASLGYLDQEGIMVSSGIKKYNVLLNLDITPSDKFKFGIRLNGNTNLIDKIANESNGGNENADPLNAALMFDPLLSPERNENGEYERNPTIALDNPVAIAYGYDNKEENNRIYGSTFGEYSITDNLKASIRLGVDINNTRIDQYTDRTTLKGKAQDGIANINSANRKYWLFESLLNYQKTVNLHQFSIMGGATWERFENLSHRSYSTGFFSDVTYTNLLQSGNQLTRQVGSSKSTRKLQSLFGRINYTFEGKYLLTATLRRDGTSRFSEENKFAIFPSLAFGWRISEEAFLKSINSISDLKLRLGYGRTGNEGINNFETIATFVAGGNAVLGGVLQNGAQPARIPNSELKWEVTEGINIGLDFGLVNNRIYGAIEYYINNSIDQLFNRPVPLTTGFENVRTNFGKVRNSGIDFSVTSRNLIGEFQWTSNIVLSTLKNEVVDLPPYVGEILSGNIVANVPAFALVREGYPMRSFYGYQVKGIFQETDDIGNTAQPSAIPGEPMFLDSDKNGVIDPNDRVVLGDPFPDLSFSINNSFRYNNFGLQIYILGVEGIHSFNGNVLESMFPVNFNRNIMAKHYFERWTPNNPEAKFPSGVNSATYFGGGRMVNSYTIQDASFLRLKNITLSYQFPLSTIPIFKSIQLSISGENLLTFTKLDAYDPEANQSGNSVEKSSYNNYPLARIFRIGANINF